MLKKILVVSIFLLIVFYFEIIRKLIRNRKAKKELKDVILELTALSKHMHMYMHKKKIDTMEETFREIQPLLDKSKEINIEKVSELMDTHKDIDKYLSSISRYMSDLEKSYKALKEINISIFKLDVSEDIVNLCNKVEVISGMVVSISESINLEYIKKEEDC